MLISLLGLIFNRRISMIITLGKPRKKFVLKVVNAFRIRYVIKTLFKFKVNSNPVKEFKINVVVTKFIL